jgi:serine/threonine-protein kinase
MVPRRDVANGDVKTDDARDQPPTKAATPPPARTAATTRPRPPAPERPVTSDAPTSKTGERAGDPGDDEGGFLTLDTVPWTTVYLGKKKLGETPLVKVPVPAGDLELVLVNPDEGVKEGYVARVKPGEVFRTRLDLR